MSPINTLKLQNKFKIFNFTFDKKGIKQIENTSNLNNWPVVYMLKNDSKIYIGETQNASERMKQHLDKKSEDKFKDIHIVFDDEFNKSAILDTEQKLIKWFQAEKEIKNSKSYEVTNRNEGQSAYHNYYQREEYIEKIEAIWHELNKEKIAHIDDTILLSNTEIFKYSPYTSLNDEQIEVSNFIVSNSLLMLNENKKGVTIVEGGAGTGKTILLISTLFRLVSSMITSKKYNAANLPGMQVELDSDDYSTLTTLRSFIKLNRPLKIGFVSPMESMRETIGDIFKNTKNGLYKYMAIGPFDAFRGNYDILFIDEAHRLAKNHVSYQGHGAFKKAISEYLNKPYDNLTKADIDSVTQLDLILRNTKYVVMAYDKNQTIKGCDISDKEFQQILYKNEQLGIFEKRNIKHLEKQMRCMGGNSYTDYINDIFNCTATKNTPVKNYDIKLFNDIEIMYKEICDKNSDPKIGLSRLVSGYSFDNSKGWPNKAIKIGDFEMPWNQTDKEYINRKDSINEVGCIHKIQGYDLNYVGIIFGGEINYNKEKNEITIDKNKFYDTNVKKGVTDKVLKNYIVNSYKVMMERGIKGCYIYCCNEGLKEYFKRFFPYYSK